MKENTVLIRLSQTPTTHSMLIICANLG